MDKRIHALEEVLPECGGNGGMFSPRRSHGLNLNRSRIADRGSSGGGDGLLLIREVQGQMELQQEEVRDIRQLVVALEYRLGALKASHFAGVLDPGNGHGNSKFEKKETADRELEREKREREAAETVKDLKRRLRSVAGSAMAGVEAVARSVEDVQQATVQVYLWADLVHATLSVLGERLDLRPPQLCPRLLPHNAVAFANDRGVGVGGVGMREDFGNNGYISNGMRSRQFSHPLPPPPPSLSPSPRPSSPTRRHHGFPRAGY